MAPFIWGQAPFISALLSWPCAKLGMTHGQLRVP